MSSLGILSCSATPNGRSFRLELGCLGVDYAPAALQIVTEMCAKHVEDPRTLLKIVNRKYADFKVYLKVRQHPSLSQAEAFVKHPHFPRDVELALSAF